MADDTMLTFELRNAKPLDLLDLTGSLNALGQAFDDYVNALGSSFGHVRLSVHEVRNGSVITDLIPTPEQMSWLWEHRDALAGFVASLNEVVSFFLHQKVPTSVEITSRKAEQLSKIVEPVAKDSGAQLNIVAQDQARVTIHNHFHVGFRDANVIQNGARRLSPPRLPSEIIEKSVLLTLEQVKNSATAKTGDRGLIQKFSQRPVRLRFMSSETKRAILDLPDNPLKRAFLVDVRVHFIEDEPRLYEIIDVHDIIESD